MHCLVTSLLVLLTLTVGFGHATEQVLITDSPSGFAARGKITVEEQAGSGLRISIDLPQTYFEIDGLRRISDGQQIYRQDSYLETGNQYTVPSVSKWVVVPPRDRVTLRVIDRSGKISEITTDNITWNGEEFDAEVFSERELHPPSPVVIGKPQVMRGVRMVPVTIFPVQVDSDGKMLVENTEIDVEFVFTPGGGVNTVSPGREKPITPDFARVLEATTLNPPVHRFPRRDPAATFHSSLLILYPEAIENQDALESIGDFVEWKRRMGFNVIVDPRPDLEDNEDNRAAEAVQAVITSHYEEEDIEYVIIIGDDQMDDEFIVAIEESDEDLHFPTFSYVVRLNEQGEPVYLDADYFYTTLDGDDDLLPEVRLGRIMVPTYDRLAGALERSILYERNPYVDEEAWLTNPLLTFDRAPDSLTYADINLMLWTQQRLDELGYDELNILARLPAEQLAETTKDHLEDGVSLALSVGWLLGATDPLALLDVAITGRKNPFVVCSGVHYINPTMHAFFAQTEDDHNGPIAVMSMNDVDLSRFIDRTVGNAVSAMRYHDLHQPGSIQLFAILDLHRYLTHLYADDEEEVLNNLAQHKILGDPTVNVFTEVPIDLRIDLPDMFAVDATSVSLVITDAVDDEGVGGVTVCIRQAEDEEVGFQGVLETDADGYVSFTIPDGLQEGELQITAYKHNCLPVVVDAPVDYPEINLVMSEYSFEDDLTNDQSTGFLFTISNTGEDDAQEVNVTLSDDNQWISFNDDEFNIGDIAAGDDGFAPDELEIIVDEDCPGGTTVRIKLEMESDGEIWEASFEVEVSGPRLFLDPELVEFENFIPGQEAEITPIIGNVGTEDIGSLRAELVSLDERIVVIDRDRTYESLEPDENGEPDQPFRVRIDPLFIPGQMARFELRISSEDDVDVDLEFEKQVSDPAVGDPLGPDEYGYYCFDSGDEDWEEAPTFRWREINREVEGWEADGQKIEFPTEALVLDPNPTLELPFEFQYYGESYESIIVSLDGWIGMGEGAEDYLAAATQPIPGHSAPDGQICLLWQDLYIEINEVDYSGVYYHYFENESLFVVEWSGVRNDFEGIDDSRVSFQVLLFDPEAYPTRSGDGEIVFQYLDFSGIPDGQYEENKYATVGLRNLDGSGGVQYSFWNDYPPQAMPLEDGMALKFTTSVLNDLVGAVTGRIVRQEEIEVGIEGARIITVLGGLTAVTDESGNFRIDRLPPGRHENAIVSAVGFNSTSISFEIESGETTDIDPVSLTHPELSLRFNPGNLDELDLRPDGSEIRANIAIDNNGNGPLEYEAYITDHDGNDPEFDQVQSLNISDRINMTAFGGYTTIDSIYLIAAKDRNSNSIFALDRNGNVFNSVDTPELNGDDVLPTSLTWTGEQLWGTMKDDVDQGWIFGINFEDSVLDPVFGSPLSAGVQLNIVYSPPRESFFIGAQSDSIVEINNEGEVQNAWVLHQSGRDLNVAGLGWNYFDPKGMNLYILDLVETDEDVSLRLIRMDVNSGEWEEMTESLPGAEEIDTYAGLSVLHDFNNSQVVISALEEADLEMTLRFWEAGPNLTFLSDGGLSDRRGILAAGERSDIGMNINAVGLPEGEHPFGIKLMHNAIDGEQFIPVTLTISENAGVDFVTDILPEEFDLTAIYPNPFNSQTRVEFTLNDATHTTLRVFDLTGREVASLFDGVPNAGTYSVTWDATMVPSGIYLIQLQSGSRFKTAKVVVLR